VPDKGLIKTGITGSRRANATSFKKGRSGNPAGRPRGSGRFRSGTRAAAALLDAEAEALAQKAIELALGGDPVAVRFCLGRVLGARRGQPVALALPALAAPGDLAAAVTAIAAGLSEGRLTPDEALSLAQMLESFPRALTAGGGTPDDDMDAAEDARRVLLERLARLGDSAVDDRR